MSEREIQELNERIRNLREQLEGPLMSAEKEYKIRFEISDLQYESLQKQIDDLKNGLPSQNMTNYRSKVRDTMTKRVDEDVESMQKRIEYLEMYQQTRVMNTEKEREVIEEVRELKGQIEKIEREKMMEDSGSGGLLSGISTIFADPNKYTRLSKENLIWAIEFREKRLKNNDLTTNEKQNIINELKQLKWVLERKQI